MYSLILNCEINGIERQEIIGFLYPVQKIFSQFPFLQRTQMWFRGYQGDFETIEYICEAQNLAIPKTIAYYLESTFLSSPVCQQHRNKVRYQADLILDTFNRNQKESNVMLIACGGCRDLRLIQKYLKNFQGGRIYINDMDAEALKFSQNHLSDIKDKIQVIPGNVLLAIKKLKSIGEFDLVVAGGLFDYLEDKTIKFIITHVYKLLKTGGKFMFTNIAKNNPYRIPMGYLSNWHLIERDEKDYLRIFQDMDLPKNAITIVRDETNLALIIEVNR